MRSPHFSFIKSKSAQRGAGAVEFALIAIPFFFLLFGAMEFGRLLYLLNTVQEVTRNAARQAVVTDFTNATAITAIKRSAVFRTDDGSLPAGAEVTNATINIRYLNAAGTVPVVMPSDPGDNISACLDATRTDSCIRFVEVSVCTGSPCASLQYAPMISLFSALNLNIPLSTVRMPIESLGFNPTS